MLPFSVKTRMGKSMAERSPRVFWRDTFCGEMKHLHSCCHLCWWAILVLLIASSPRAQTMPGAGESTTGSSAASTSAGAASNQMKSPVDSGGGGFSGGGSQSSGSGGGPLLGLRQVDQPKTLTLEEALSVAANENFDLRMAQESIIQQEANVRRAWSYLLPRVSLGGAYTYAYPEQTVDFIDEDQMQQQALLYHSLADLTEATSAVSSDRRQRQAGQERAEELRNVATELENTTAESIVIQPAHSLTGEVSVSFPLFNGRSIPLLMNAYDGVELTRAATKQVQAALLYSVARTYYSVFTAEKMTQLAERQVQNAKAHQETVEERVELGVATPLSLQRAKLNLVRAEQSRRDMSHGYEMALGALGSLLGVDHQFVITAPKPMVAVEEGVAVEEFLMRALKNRPERQVQRLSVTVADRGRTDAWMMFMPSLALVGRGRYNSNTSGFSSQPLTGTMMVTASVPIYDGGERYAALKESASRIRTELLKTRQLEMRIGQELRGALGEVSIKKEALKSAHESAKLARETSLNAANLYELGLATSLDVIDTDLAVHFAEIEKVQAEFALEQSRIRLAFVLGEYPSVLELDIPTQARMLSADEEAAARRGNKGLPPLSDD
jgi:outer membrane protein